MGRKGFVRAKTVVFAGENSRVCQCAGNLLLARPLLSAGILRHLLGAPMQLSELLAKSSFELLEQAEDLHVEKASTMREVQLTFAIIEKLRAQGRPVIAEGVLDVIPREEFGFIRMAHSNYGPGPYDVYVGRAQVRKFWLRTGDMVSGEIRGPNTKEAYCALLKVAAVNFNDPAKAADKSAGTEVPMPVSQSEVVELLGL